MKNVLILGASGSLAQYVIDELKERDDINFTLFLRNKKRLRNNSISWAQLLKEMSCYKTHSNYSER